MTEAESLSGPLPTDHDGTLPKLPDDGVANSSHHFIYLVVALTTVVVPMLGAGYAATLYWQDGISATDLCLVIGMYFVTVLGIELGFHRYLTHRSMKTSRGMKVLFTIAGCMAADGPPIWWTAIHRRHHTYGDHDGDPHSPNLHGQTLWQRVKGHWHSHIGWMFRPKYTAAYSAMFAKDLLKDGTIQRLDRWYVVWVLLGLAIPALIGGLVAGSWHGAWTGLIWGGLVRMFLGQHALWWGIVTACHTIGTQPFQTNDDSKNNVLVAILFLGDGWHNNHHAFPASAKVGFQWWEFDITWWVVKLLERTGLVWEVKVPSAELIAAKRKDRRQAPAAGLGS